MVVLSSFPFLERRQLLRNSGKEANDDANRGGFHVVAELADNLLVLFGVSDVEKKVSGEMSLQESGNGNQIASLPTLRAESQPP